MAISLQISPSQVKICPLIRFYVSSHLPTVLQTFCLLPPEEVPLYARDCSWLSFFPKSLPATLSRHLLPVFFPLSHQTPLPFFQ